jgi:hypothetical protein
MPANGLRSRNANQMQGASKAKTLHAFAVRNLRKICADRARSFVAALKACNADRSPTDPLDSHLDVLALLRSPMFLDYALTHVGLQAVNADPELAAIMGELDLPDEANARLAAEIDAGAMQAFKAALSRPKPAV